MVDRIAILSSASGGGAGIAAKRLCDGLNRTGTVTADFIDNASLKTALPRDVCLPGNATNERYTNTHFTGEYGGYSRGWMIELLSGYDAVNVHWASYLLSTQELIDLAQTGQPILITMHDFYYATGGCHYPAGCIQNHKNCLSCPQVRASTFSRADVTKAYLQKRALMRYPNVHISAPSRHLLREVVRSGIVTPEKARCIRNIYEPPEELPPASSDRSEKIMLIADSLVERRKGMMLALESLEHLAAQSDKTYEVHVVGNASDDFRARFEKLNLKADFYGRLDDHRDIVSVFQSVGIILSCSFEDNWPNILVEAGAYGVVPVVGSGHGCEEFSKTYDIGHVATEFTPQGFAAALQTAIEHYPDTERIEAYQRQVRSDHKAETILAGYLEALQTSRAAGPAEPEASSHMSAIAPVQEPADKTTGPFSEVSYRHTKYGVPKKTVIPPAPTA